MSIATELTLLANSKQAIKNSINAKGGSITDSTPFADYSTAIDNLPSGGSGNPILTSIDVSDFSGTTFNTVASYITDVTIPSGVTSIVEAFKDCSHLTSANIPNSVTSIGASAFERCVHMLSINIPSGVTSIGNFAFSYCNSLRNITIPSGVTSIGNFAFNYNISLTSITCNATTPPTLGTKAFDNTNNCPIYVPAASVDAYKAANNWSTYASRIYPIQQVATVDGNPVYNYDLGMTSTDTITSENMAKMPAGTNLELAEGLTNIAAGEINYQEVILPSTFTGFGDSDMIGSNVTTITSNAVTPPSVFRNQLGGSGLTAIYVPAESVDAYKTAWADFASIIQAIPTE